MSSAGDTHDRALDQAAAWIARLRAGDSGRADQRAFARWLAADPANAAAFDRMLELWRDLGALRALPLEIPAPAPRRLRRRHLAGALAAGTALVLLLVYPRSTTPPPLELRTAVGGFDTVVLEDGSELMLNTDTALRVRLAADARTVQMERGEAFFRVAHDASRPFTAVCGPAQVTVIGTAFNARCEETGMEVLVERGRVRFGGRRDATAMRMLEAGDRAQFTRAAGLGTVETVRPAAALAWRQRRLVFENASLAEVMAEMQRYLEPTLRLADAGLGQLRVSGVFGTEDPGLALEALERSLELRIEGPAQGPLLVYRAGTED